MIVRGDRDAAWRFYAFENNLIEEDPSELLDPKVIKEEDFAEALSVSFFEARLFLKGTYEDPVQARWGEEREKGSQMGGCCKRSEANGGRRGERRDVSG